MRLCRESMRASLPEMQASFNYNRFLSLSVGFAKPPERTATSISRGRRHRGGRNVGSGSSRSGHGATRQKHRTGDGGDDGNGGEVTQAPAPPPPQCLYETFQCARTNLDDQVTLYNRCPTAADTADSLPAPFKASDWCFPLGRSRGLRGLGTSPH